MAQVNELFIIFPKENTSASKVITEGESVHAGTSANSATFPDPPNSMADFLIALNLLKAADAVPERERNKVTNELRDKRKEDFIRVFLKPNATYVLSVANGDRFTAALSGHTLNKEQRNPISVGAISGDFEEVGPAPGTARIKLTNRGGCAIFLVAIQEANGGYRLLDGFNTQEFVVGGLPSGQSNLRIHGKKGDENSPYIYLVAWAV